MFPDTAYTSFLFLRINDQKHSSAVFVVNGAAQSSLESAARIMSAVPECGAVRTRSIHPLIDASFEHSKHHG